MEGAHIDISINIFFDLTRLSSNETVITPWIVRHYPNNIGTNGVLHPLATVLSKNVIGIAFLDKC